MNDKNFLEQDKRDIKRTKNLRLLPLRKDRIGGKKSYGEWCHVIGIFQTLIYQTLSRPTNNHILDVGCGNGIMGIAAEPFIGENGRFVGLDVQQSCIDFCRKQYPMENYSFLHHNVKNARYAPLQPEEKKRWPLEPESFDLITALSLWTHLTEEDALFYLQEAARVVRPGGRALITFFYLNDRYYSSLEQRSDAPGRYHMTKQQEWVFDRKISGSEHWYQLDDVPETAVGIDTAGMELLQKSSGFKIHSIDEGNWKEFPGIFFQDIVIFEKEAL